MSARHKHHLAPKARVSTKTPQTIVIENKIVKARKKHLLECNCIIHPGELYHRMRVRIGRNFIAENGHAGPCLKLEVLH